MATMCLYGAPRRRERPLPCAAPQAGQGDAVGTGKRWL